MDFKNSYSRDEWRGFFQDEFLPEEFEPRLEPVELFLNTKYIKQLTILGEHRSWGLTVYEIRHESANDPRVSLTKETFRIMKEYGHRYVLALYTSPQTGNYRLSYATLGLAAGDKKVAVEYSNPHRYSYYLGPDARVHTPSFFLEKKGRIEGLEDLKERFSVEVVNKEFYREIAKLFTKLVGGKRQEGNKTTEYQRILRLASVTDHKTLQEFAVRMIGRVVFCWFLKKKATLAGKPLIPEEVLSLQAVLDNENYYHTVLEKLFFQVLNTPQEKRREDFKTGPFHDIPFLNGGLFEPHTDDVYEIDSFTGLSHINDVIVKNKWLEDFFTLLETYNFTIDENTSMDVELSVDPEMLGQIFEKLLAEINPETGETARKSTGSYYTPRPIVEYMVDESLKQYLKTKTAIAEKKLDQLLSFSLDMDELDEGERINEEEKRAVIDALDQVKIIDPACGSGAFPMGVLQKLVLILEKIDPLSKIWLEKHLERFPYDLQKYVRQSLEKENVNYIHKMGLIRNAIYGVDIQQIAVEISKLRVFLALVVDAAVDDSAQNRGINPLPNLEFKFVCANTLKRLPQEGNKEFGGLFDDRSSINELKILRDKYFNSFSTDKEKIKEDFTQLKERMSKQMVFYKIEDKSKANETLELYEWEPFSDKPSDWFEADWMFGIKSGFDIVIANPPYVRQEAIKKIKPQLKKDFGDFYCGTADLYTYFFKLGLEILNNGGHLCFIAPNKFMKSGYGKNTRRLLSKGATPKLVIDFGELPVFEAGTDPSIILVENRKPVNEEFTAAVIKSEEEIIRLNEVVNSRGLNLEVSSLNSDGWTLAGLNILNLLKKLFNNNIPLGEYVNGQFYRGVLTGFNEAFIINEATKTKLIAEDPASAELIKPWLRGQDIRKWRAEWKGWYVIFTRRGVNIEKYPAIKRHLEKFREDLEPKKSELDPKGRKPGTYKWYEIQDNIAYYAEFDRPKIIYADIAKLMRASYDNSSMYCANTLYIMPTDDFSLLGILHSRLFDWFARYNFQPLGDPWKGGRLRFIAQYMEKFPIPILTGEQKYPIIQIVKQILANPVGPQVKQLEKEIDQLVYGLYGLTEEEIAIVEREIGGE